MDEHCPPSNVPSARLASPPPPYAREPMALTLMWQQIGLGRLIIQAGFRACTAGLLEHSIDQRAQAYSRR